MFPFLIGFSAYDKFLLSVSLIPTWDMPLKYQQWFTQATHRHQVLLWVQERDNHSSAGEGERERALWPPKCIPPPVAPSLVGLHARLDTPGISASEDPRGRELYSLAWSIPEAIYYFSNNPALPLKEIFPRVRIWQRGKGICSHVLTVVLSVIENNFK